MRSSRQPLNTRVGYLLALGILGKFFIDTSNQIFNPYLLVYAAGIGVSGLTMGKLVSLRNLSGLTAPVIGMLADRFGYRRMMRINLLLVAAGILMFALAQKLWTSSLAMVLWGIGQGGFAPNAHSYLSARLPWEKRSRFLGMLEYSWALAGIIGLFFIGMILQKVGWRFPLFLLAGALVGASLLIGTLPRNHFPGTPDSFAVSGSSVAANPGTSFLQRFLGFFYLGPHQSSAWAAILVNAFNFFAAFHIIIAHGAFLELEYNLSPATLGRVALLMGLTDWVASILVSTIGDRVGKKRSLVIGTTGLMVFSFLFPLTNTGIGFALVGLLLPRFFFEYATVSNFPLLSEQYPVARGRVMSLGIAGGLIGTTIAATTGPAAYLRFGLGGLGPVSGISAAISLFLLVFFVKERPHRSEPSR